MTAAPPHARPSTYRLDHRLGLRLLGIRFIIAAVLVVATAVAASVLGGFLTYALGIAAAVVIVTSLVLAARPPMIIRLDAAGYRIGRPVRSSTYASDAAATVRTAPWRAVVDARQETTAAGLSLVVRLESGATSTVPLLLVAGRAKELQRELRDRLDHAHGYRRRDA